MQHSSLITYLVSWGWSWSTDRFANSSMPVYFWGSWQTETGFILTCSSLYRMACLGLHQTTALLESGMDEKLSSKLVRSEKYSATARRQATGFISWNSLWIQNFHLDPFPLPLPLPCHLLVGSPQTVDRSTPENHISPKASISWKWNRVNYLNDILHLCPLPIWQWSRVDTYVHRIKSIAEFREDSSHEPFQRVVMSCVELNRASPILTTTDFWHLNFEALSTVDAFSK